MGQSAQVGWIGSSGERRLRRDRIGRYLVTTTFDQGGMGTVYLARERGGLEVAVTSVAAGREASSEMREHLRAVLRTRSHLEHANLARVYEMVEDRGEIFIAEEFVLARSLDDLLSDTQGGEPMTVDAALEIVLPVLAGLEYAHAHGVVHRAVHPGLIVPSVDGSRVRLKGLGVTAVAEAWRGAACLSDLAPPGYLSPEQRIGQAEVDRHADIYSCAVVLFRLLTGRLPYRGDAASLPSGRAEVPDARRLAPGVPEAVSRAIAIALRLEPHRRFHSASDFRAALEAASAGLFPAEPAMAAAPAAASVAAAAATGPAADPTVAAPSGAEAPPPAATADSPLAQPPIDRLQILVFSAAAAILLIVGMIWMLHVFGAKPSQLPPPHETSIKVPPEPFAEPVIPELPKPVQILKPMPVLPRIHRPVTTPVIRVPPQLPKAAPPIETITAPVPVLIDQVRTDLQKEIDLLISKLDAQDLSGVDADVAALASQAGRYPELSAEAARVEALRQRVQKEQNAAADRALREALWTKRLEDIEKLIQERKYPEAHSLAVAMTEEQGLPATVGAQAQQLSAEALAGLQKAFQGTTLGQTQNTLVKPPARKERS